MEFITDYKIEEYALNTRWIDFPKHIQHQAIMCGVDLVCALILGSYGKQFKAGEKLAQSYGMIGDIGIIGSSNLYNLLGASIALGHSSNSFDIDDGHRIICGHPGTSFIGGVLAAAYERNISIQEYLTTLVVCYELTIRWAMAMQKEYNFLHSTGSYGAFGTAIGVGRILGLNRTELNNALSIADYHAPMVPVMRAVEYPSMNKDGVPFGALIGTMSVLETLAGVTGKTHILEMPKYSEYISNLGTKYHILDLYFKQYTCCRWAHQPIFACLELMNEHRINYKHIDSIKINTFLAASKLSKSIPRNTDEAQYNISYPVACAVVHGDVGFLQIRDEALNNADVINIMNKISFYVDPLLEKEFPHKRLSSIEIRLNNSKTYKSKIYSAPGEPEDPNLNLNWITNKFMKMTSSMLKNDDQLQIIKMIIENNEFSIRDLVKYINKSLIMDI